MLVYISGNTSASDIRKTIRERRRHKASSKKQSFEECERKKKVTPVSQLCIHTKLENIAKLFFPNSFPFQGFVTTTEEEITPMIWQVNLFPESSVVEKPFELLLAKESNFLVMWSN